MKVFDFSILVCHAPNPIRRVMLSGLKAELYRQIFEAGVDGRVEILIDDTNQSIGAKSNDLMAKAWGRYGARFDDDDWPRKTYIKSIFEGIEKDVDCCSLKGMYYEDDIELGVFEHSLKHREWINHKQPVNGVLFERYPNHLNAIKLEKVKHIRYPEINHGEDKAWSDEVFRQGVLKSEHVINDIIYNYKKVNNKSY